MLIRSSCLILVVSIVLLFQSCISQDSIEPIVRIDESKLTLPITDFSPEKYICYRGRNIEIDGSLDETSWQNAEWTADFTDIEGESLAAPLYQTHVKMLWDDEFLYIAAEIFEPHIWAYLQQRDTVIFYDNDFEVFIDPDGDTHGYYEFEINALNTVWDLLLTRPYRDHGKVLDAWNINGLQSAIQIYGSLNMPSDTDEKWIIELAFPFSVLEEWGNKAVDGRQWRINFSRVNWRTTIEKGVYKKKINPETNKSYPEFNWVWSPQGVINMHAPETWGYLQFSDIYSGEGKAEFIYDNDESIKWNLRQLYYAQRDYATDNKKYTDKLTDLADYKAENYKVNILLKPGGYEAFIKSESTNKLWLIDNEGKVVGLKIKD